MCQPNNKPNTTSHVKPKIKDKVIVNLLAYQVLHFISFGSPVSANTLLCTRASGYCLSISQDLNTFSPIC